MTFCSTHFLHHVLAKLVELEHLAGERLDMGCLQKGHWSQFYLRKRIFRTLFVSRVLSLKVMVRPGNTILVLNIFFCLLACISLFVFLFFLELRRRAACHFIKIEKKVHREGESPRTKYQTHPHTYITLHTQNKEILCLSCNGSFNLLNYLLTQPFILRLLPPGEFSLDIC